jgi:hypothetical protein
MRCFAIAALAASMIVALPAVAQSPSNFAVTSVSLYQPDSILTARLGRDASVLAAYINAVKEQAAESFASLSQSEGVTGAIVVAVKPLHHSRLWLVLGGNNLPAPLQGQLKSRIESVPTPDVQDGPIAFAINFTFVGGGQPVINQERPIPIPQEWLDAMKGSSPGILPDAPLAMIWPDSVN